MANPTVPVWLPIAISALALGVSLIALGWQIAKHILDGGRVLVQLNPALWDPGHALRTMDSRTGAWRSPGQLKEGRTAGAECAVLVVENAGRTAVTITDPGVAYRGKRPRWFRRRVKRSLTPRMLGPAGDIDKQIQPTAAPYRLEPYSRVIYLLDIHSAIDHARANLRPGKRVVMRGKVVVAGRRRAVRSAGKRRWRVPATARSLDRYAPSVPVERAVVLILLRHRVGGVGAEPLRVSSLEYASRLIAARLWELRDVHSQRQRVERALDDEVVRIECGEPIAMNMVTYHLTELLSVEPEALDWTGARRQHQLEFAPSTGRDAPPELPPATDTPSASQGA
ncbi:hypothetical protein [Cellulomonas hominis]|uniref:hypothetical protein n=1 Tax=Cellulomonas hominis TaxID=156981 RepID=UPI001B8EE5C3|nr:hypothetical protein [Cellulomonas hominis]VTR76981.1 hypothetical protein CHMI_01749 [Cellulomonas hominis]